MQLNLQFYYVLILFTLSAFTLNAQVHISPSNQATGVTPPVNVEWMNAGSANIEVYVCTVDTDAPMGSVDLDGYVLTSGPTYLSSIPDDLSGITFNAITGTLFMIVNGATTIYETDLNGNILRSIFLSGFDDTEGIVHLYGTRYAVTEERRGRITYIDIVGSTSTINYSSADYVQLPGSWNNNQGLEGIGYDPATDEIHTIKEKTPKAHYNFTTPTSFPYAPSSVNQPCDLSLDPYGFGDVSGMHHMGSSSTFSQLEVDDHVLILSHESRALIETDPACGEISRISLTSGGANGTINMAIPQPEGITMGDDGTLYIVGEPNHLYKFNNPDLNLNPVSLGALAYSGTGTGGTHTIPYNNLTPGEQYCWRLNSGSGWTNFWSFRLTSDNLPPSVFLTSPADGTVYNSSGSITLSASASDADGNITSVEFYVDGVPIGSDATSPYTTNYMLTNGTHTITAIATDNSNNQTTSDPVTITANIANVAPTVEITSPSDGLVLGSFATVNIIANANDIDGTIAQVEFFVNGTPIGTDNTPPTYSQAYALLVDGIYSLVAVATDSEGESSSDTITVRLGPNAPPKVNLVSPLNDTTLTSFTNFIIKANASDPDQGGDVEKVDFFINGNLYGSDDVAPYELPYDFIANGVYSVSAIATDNEGATQTDGPLSITVDVDNFPPLTQIISPTDGATYSPLEVISIYAAAEDPDGEMQHVEFFIDGVSLEIDDEYPFMIEWLPPGTGTYEITAIATDEEGTESNTSQITVNVEYGQILTATSSISSGNDDVEQFPDGEMYFNSSDLEFNYDNNRGDQTVGLLFRNLNIPQGAMIVNAHIQFTSDETDSQTTTTTIRGEANDSPSDFTSVSNNLTLRPLTSASVSWSIPTWGSVGAQGSAQKTPNIKAVIQEIVSRPGFSTNSPIVISFSGSGQRVADSYEGSAANAPTLSVEYTLDTCPDAGLPCDDGDINTENDLTDGNCGCEGEPALAGQYLDIQISSGNDDVEENGINGDMYMYSSDLELVYDRPYTGNQLVGLRFDNVFLPSNATITNAYIQFTVDESRNNAGALTIHGEANSNSAPFVNSPYNVSSRAQTSASVNWSPPSWNTIGQTTADQRTPDISSIVQEILNSSGWAPQNAMTFMIDGTGRRVAESYEGSEEMAPILHIEYTINFTDGDNNPNNITNENDDDEPELDDRETFSFSAYDLAEMDINVYPNPAEYEVNVQLNLQGIDETQGTVTLYDTHGKMLHQEIFNPQIDQGIDFNVEALTQGMYLITVEAGKYSATKKLIKKRM